jgi:uncharacterized iron-regulated protein
VSWFTLLVAFVKATGALAQFLSERQLLNAGEAETIARIQKEQIDAFRRANSIRDDLERELDADPSRVRERDPFRRD